MAPAARLMPMRLAAGLGSAATPSLFEREGRDWPRFYDAVRQLTQLPQPERHAALRALAKNSQPLTPSKEKPGV